MTSKDWILLLIPILLNGIIVFTLQKIFEKKQLDRNKKRAYVITFKEHVEKSLDLYEKILFTVATADEKTKYEMMERFIASIQEIICLQDMYRALLKPLKEKTQKLAFLMNQVVDFVNSKYFDVKKFDETFEELKRTLDDLHLYCVQF